MSFLLEKGLVDKRGFTRIDELAKQIQVLINKKEFKKASDIENVITDLLAFETFGFDLNNFLAKMNSTKLPSESFLTFIVDLNFE